MGAEKKYLYKNFGDFLVQLRLKSGHAQQSDLANLVKTSQQTISRWESGESRPRAKQVPILANILNVDSDELLVVAGYTARAPAATFDKPFPVDALDPDSFERFCFYFLSERYPDAKVHRVGAQGHTQDGLDVEVIFNDSTSYSFQCKRVDEFGPAKVRAVVEKHTRAATKKFLLLSRHAASPQSRQEIRKYKDWDILDREDVSRIIRQELSIDQQRGLVRTFFRGQGLALLGEAEIGPLQTSTQFFSAFVVNFGAFNHQWELVGREKEVKAIIGSLLDENIRAVFLISPGGGGKTRTLKQAVEDFEKKNKAVLVRVLSPSEIITSKSLDDLGKGEKLLIVDDAHDQNDLQILFQYAAILENNMKLLLASRPYAIDYIKGQASNFSLTDERITEIKLNPLSLKQATQLAAQVLEKFNGPVSKAQYIARLTLDCPLFTVIGAQAVAKEGESFELVKNKDIFRSTLMGKFRDIIAGDIGSRNDAELIKKLLTILAIIQPFHPEDESIARVAEQVEGISSVDANRLIRLLVDAGILFKRGGQYRLSPDLLADYMIEKSCIGVNGKSTGNDTYIEHVLVNLGKLSNSALLDGVWQKLKPSRKYSDPHIRAVTAVAYYQPGRALEFTENLIQEGAYLRDLPIIIKHAAYNIEYLLHACECLWELGKNDKRAPNQHPGHAIRTLSELCAIEPDKPVEYNAVVVDFGLSLFNEKGLFNGAYTAFDILKVIMKTESHTIASNGINLSYRPFQIPFDAVSALREKIIDTTINLLTHTSTKIGVLAAQFLQEGLQYPSGILGMPVSCEIREAWEAEFVKTLDKILNKIQARKLDPLVLISLIHSVSWHAHRGMGKTEISAKKIINSLPESLEFRTSLALVYKLGDVLGFFGRDHHKQEQEFDKYLKVLENDLIAEYPDGNKLRFFLEIILDNIEKNYTAGNSSSEIFYRRIIQLSSTLAQSTIDAALNYSNLKTNQFAGLALSKIMSDNHDYGLTIARKFIESKSHTLQFSAGHAYRLFALNGNGCTEEDLVILKQILSSKEERVVLCGIGVVRPLAKNNQALAIELLKSVDIGVSSEVADAVFVLVSHDDVVPFCLLTNEDVACFLGKMAHISELDGYWVEVFLSNVSIYHAQLGAEFFMGRVDYAVSENNWHFIPCTHSSGINETLRFRESEEFTLLLRQVYQWMTSHLVDDNQFIRLAVELFDTMFGPLDDEILEFIQVWIDISTPDDILVISEILGEAPNDFVFGQRVFVSRFLNRVKQHGPEMLNIAVSALYHSATSDVKTGALGEPFPQDVKVREEAKKILQETPRFTPAYKLYEALKKNAEANIKFSHKARDEFYNE